MIVIEQANPTNLSSHDITRAYEIMHHAYSVTEIDILGENYSRMDVDEFQELIDREELIVARIDGEIVGSIHAYSISENTYCFGLFSAAFEKKGLGIGRALITAAENTAIKNGASFMELEILKPRDHDIDVKINLKNWYERLGYELFQSTSFEARKPDKIEKALKLIQPCVFDCYRKKLA